MAISGYDSKSGLPADEYSVTLGSCRSTSYEVDISLLFPCKSSSQFLVNIVIRQARFDSCIAPSSSRFVETDHCLLPLRFPDSFEHRSFLLTVSFSSSGVVLFVNNTVSSESTLLFPFSSSPTLLNLGTMGGGGASDFSDLGILISYFTIMTGSLPPSFLSSLCLLGPHYHQHGTLPMIKEPAGIMLEPPYFPSSESFSVHSVLRVDLSILNVCPVCRIEYRMIAFSPYSLTSTSVKQSPRVLFFASHTAKKSSVSKLIGNRSFIEPIPPY